MTVDIIMIVALWFERSPAKLVYWVWFSVGLCERL